MPRYYRRRYTRVVRPKKKWASNITVWNAQSLTGSYAALLVSNSAQASSPTPTILKVGNFKISADVVFKTSGSNADYNFSCMAYILYVPEGWESSASAFNNLISKHPEWIMATKTLGVTSTTSSQNYTETLNLSTRLKRNLNSGDQVVFYLQFSSPGSITVSSASITGNCRYWTCAN